MCAELWGATIVEEDVFAGGSRKQTVAGRLNGLRKDSEELCGQVFV